MIEEEKYLEIREKLKNLPKLKASEGFTARLQSKILSIEAEETVYQNQNLKRSEGGFFQHIFGRQRNTWLIPASGFAVILIVAGIFYFSPGDDPVQLAGTQPETSEQELAQNTGEKEPVTDAGLKEMKKEEPVASENLTDNTQTETIEDLPLTPSPPVSTDRTSDVQNESRVRPEIKIDTEDVQQSEEKINEEFQTSTAIENMGARSKNEDRGSNINKRGDTSSLLRSRRSPVQVSTIKKVELESLKEKVSD
jgi:hypothetical protein